MGWPMSAASFRDLLWSIQGVGAAYLADWLFGAPVNLMPRGVIGLAAFLVFIFGLIWLGTKRAGR